MCYITIPICDSWTGNFNFEVLLKYSQDAVEPCCYLEHTVKKKKRKKNGKEKKYDRLHCLPQSLQISCL